jgi:hypothetical protein
MGFLSSLFGSSKSQPSTSTVIQSQKLPPEIAPAVKKVVDEAEAIYDAEKAAGYIPYEGATLAPFTAEEEAAQAGLAGLVGTQQPFIDESLGITRAQTQAFTPEIAQQFMSPYQRAVTDIEKREAQRVFERDVQPSLEAKAIQQGGGMSGLGTRAALEASEAQREQGRLLADIEARGLQSAFQDARSAFEQQKAREANAAAAIGRAGAETFKSGLAEQGVLQTVGEEKRDLAQSALDEEYFKFLEEREFPQQRLSEYSGFVYGNPLSRIPTQSTNTTGTPFQPSFGRQLLGIGSTLGSAFLGSNAGGNMFANFLKGAKTGGGLSDIMKRKGGGGFPDMSGDGKVTQKDILMGRGVIAREVGGDLDVDEAESMSMEALRERSLMEAELARLQAAKTKAPNVSGLRKFGIRPEGYYTQAAKEDAEARRKLLQSNIPFSAQAASDFLAALGRAAVREEGNVGAAFTEETAKSAKERKDTAKALKALELQEIEKSRAATEEEYGRPAAIQKAKQQSRLVDARIRSLLNKGKGKRPKFTKAEVESATSYFEDNVIEKLNNQIDADENFAKNFGKAIKFEGSQKSLKDIISSVKSNEAIMAEIIKEAKILANNNDTLLEDQLEKALGIVLKRDYAGKSTGIYGLISSDAELVRKTAKE